MPAKYVQQDVRAGNKSLIFTLMFPNEQYSRADIARITGLSRVSTSSVISQMLEMHMVREVGIMSREGRGKRATSVSVDGDYWRIITVDISSAKTITGAITTLKAEVLEQMSVENPGAASGEYHSAEASFEAVSTLVSQLIEHSNAAHILGISVSCSGAIDHEGNVIRSTSLGWFHFPLAHLLHERFNLPVCVENDAHLALLAERYLGKGTQNFLLVRMHRGVGAAIMIDDQLITGPTGAAGEIGHVVVEPNGQACVCGKRGCLETVVSVPKMREIITADPSSRARVDAQAGQWLAMALALPVNLLELNDIVIDGPEDVVDDELLHAIGLALKQRVDSDFLTAPHLRRCELGESAVLKGAAIKLVRTIVEQTGR